MRSEMIGLAGSHEPEGCSARSIWNTRPCPSQPNSTVPVACCNSNLVNLPGGGLGVASVITKARQAEVGNVLDRWNGPTNSRLR